MPRTGPFLWSSLKGDAPAWLSLPSRKCKLVRSEGIFHRLAQKVEPRLVISHFGLGPPRITVFILEVVVPLSANHAADTLERDDIQIKGRQHIPDELAVDPSPRR